MSDTVGKIDQAIASINKGTDKKEEMRMMMAPYADWDKFLAPAPLSIAVLGQLLLISSDTDFSLQNKEKTIQFKLLKYPDSFRACLVQVSNSGWGAFNKAHTSMDQIRLHSGNVDKHVRAAVKFLVGGSPPEVELMVPDALKSIGRIADECLLLATSVEDEFVFVMELVGELLEACTRAKGQYEQDLKDTETAIQVATKQKEAIEKQKEQAEQRQRKMMKQMEDAQKEYKEALDSMPSTADIFALGITDGLLEVTKGISGFFASKIPRPFSSESSAASVSSPAPSRQDSDGDSDELDKAKELLKLMRDIKEQTKNLEKMACGRKKGRNVPQWNDIGNVKSGAQYIKMTLESLKKKLPVDGSKIQESMDEICSDGMEICETLLDLMKAMNKDEGEVREVTEQARNLSSKVENILSGAASFARGGNSLPSKPPRQAKQVHVSQDGGGGGGMVDSAIQGARFKTETAKEMLKDSRKAYEKSCEDLDSRIKDMGNVLADLSKFNLKKIDHEAIRKTLIRGIEALAQLREQWGKLVKFFQMLSSLVKCCLHTSLETFISTSRNQKKLAQAGYGMSDTMRDVMFEQAFQANQIAYVVNSISSVYVEISEKHLMDRITCLGELIPLDPQQDMPKILQKKQELNEGCKKAQHAIARIAGEKKREMSEAFDKRIGRIETEVESLMPPIPQEDVRKIQEQVKTAMVIGKAATEEDLDDLV